MQLRRWKKNEKLQTWWKQLEDKAGWYKQHKELKSHAGGKDSRVTLVMRRKKVVGKEKRTRVHYQPFHIYRRHKKMEGIIDEDEIKRGWRVDLLDPSKLKRKRNGRLCSQPLASQPAARWLLVVHPASQPGGF
jgi:hypothetical protein